MSIKRQAIRGVAVNLIGVVVAFGVTFFTTPILIRQLGDVRYGLWIIVATFGTYYMLAQLGLGPAATKYIAQYEATGDRESTLKSLATAFFLHLPIAVLIVAAAGILSWALPYWFDIAPELVGPARLMTILMGFSSAATLLAQPFGATIMAMRRFALNSSLNIVMHAANGGLAIYLMLSGYGLVALSASVLTVTSSIGLMRVVIAMSLLKSLPLRPSLFDKQEARQLISFGLLGSMQTIANQGSTGAGVIIIGSICGPGLVVYYSITQSFLEKLHELCVTIGVPLMPIASALDSQGRQEDLAEAHAVCTRVLLSIAISFIIALIAIGRPFIDLWIKPGYSDIAYPILCIVAFAMIPSAIRQSSVSILRGKNKMKVLSKVDVFEFAAVVTSGVALTWMYGVFGMAFAFLITKWIFSGTLLPATCCRALGMNLGNYWRGAIVVPLTACVPAVLVAVALAFYLPPSNLIQVLVQAGVVAVINLGTSFFVIFDRNTQKEIFRAVTLNLAT